MLHYKSRKCNNVYIFSYPQLQTICYLEIIYYSKRSRLPNLYYTHLIFLITTIFSPIYLISWKKIKKKINGTDEKYGFRRITKGTVSILLKWLKFISGLFSHDIRSPISCNQYQIAPNLPWHRRGNTSGILRFYGSNDKWEYNFSAYTLKWIYIINRGWSHFYRQLIQ